MRRRLTVLLLLALSAPGCRKESPPRTAAVQAQKSKAAPASSEEAAYSNIAANDYVGPEVCGSCHKKNYALWKEHPHSSMNANASHKTVVGDFGGVRVEYGGGVVEFDRVDGQHRMTLYKQGRVHRRYAVTRTVGARLVQMYVGVQTEGPEPRDGDLAWVYEAEMKLPFAWWVLRKEWFPETYDELPPTAEYDADGSLSEPYDFYDRHPKGAYHWQANCIRCHNTYPYELRLLPGRRTGFPRGDLKHTGELPKAAADAAGWSIVDDKELVTVGISCESCHLGGREHAEEDRAIRFVPSSPKLTVAKATPELLTTKGARASAYVMNSICRQCHSAVTPGPDYPDGSGIYSSREAKDLAGGACDGAVRCTHCHNPHEAGPVGGGGAGTPDEASHVGACIRCHMKYTMPKAVQAHTHHPQDAGVTCLDCHMPRIVHGLADMVRSHRISSPTDGRMYSAGAPNACNLCHLDRSVLWTTWQIERRWGFKLNPNDLWKEQYGGALNGPAGLRWLKHSQPITRLAAAAAFSHLMPTRPEIARQALPSVLAILEDPSPPNRLLGQFAVERIIGRRLTPDEYRSWAPPADRATQVAKLRSALVPAVPPP